MVSKVRKRIENYQSVQFSSWIMDLYEPNAIVSDLVMTLFDDFTRRTWSLGFKDSGIKITINSWELSGLSRLVKEAIKTYVEPSQENVFDDYKIRQAGMEVTTEDDVKTFVVNIPWLQASSVVPDDQFTQLKIVATRNNWLLTTAFEDLMLKIPYNGLPVLDALVDRVLKYEIKQGSKK